MLALTPYPGRPTTVAKRAAAMNSSSSARAGPVSSALPLPKRRCPTPARRAAPTRRGLTVRASVPGGMVVKEASTGVEFPEVAHLWAGAPARCLGATVRAKKIAIVAVKVYAVALYVEAEKAARELGVRSRGGFFAGDDDGDYCAALVDGAFHKALRIDLVRDVEGSVFYEALEAAMGARVRLVGEGEALAAFGSFFGARKLAKGTAILMLWRPDGKVEVAVCADGGAGRAAAAFAAADAAELAVDAPGLGRALFETYLGEASVVPAGRKLWADGARALLESEEVRRDTR